MYIPTLQMEKVSTDCVHGCRLRTYIYFKLLCDVASYIAMNLIHAYVHVIVHQ